MSKGLFASGYWVPTTNKDGYMRLKAADFTSGEMAEETRLYMYAPTFEPCKEQDEEDYAPYEKVDITDVTIPIVS